VTGVSSISNTKSFQIRRAIRCRQVRAVN
jgi:hypothetical protein